ncbi:MAG: global cell cycle regulator GcrA-like protein [Alphaproteobacteria bacterium]|nr:global cell cycle regulator GcrA-like protein [Alphaproteobacteria bacterium]
MAEALQWTEDRLKKLKTLWEKGLSISQIGEELGVSRNAIAGKVHRLGLPKRQSPISGKSQSKPAAAPKPKVEVAEPENLPLKLALRNINWSRSRCSWPIGDPKTTAFKFCGDEVVVGKPYCNDHCFEAYTTSRDQGGS